MTTPSSHRVSPTRWVYLAGCVAYAASVSTGWAATSLLSTYDVIVRNNFSTSTDVRGLVVAANYTGTAGGPFAQDLASTTPGTDTAFIQNSIAASSSGLTMQYGSLAFGGASIPGRTISFNQGGNTVHYNSSFNFASVFNGISTESASNAALSANSTSLLSGNLLTFTVGATLPASGGTAVFSIDTATLGNGGIAQYDLNLNGKSPAAIIINVTGSAGYTFNRPGGANFVGNLSSVTWYGKTLWNFNGASAVNYGAGWKGSILAPDATVTSTGDLDGSLAAYNATLSGEVHLPMWSGASSVPEPSTWAAAGSVALLVGITLLRRRQASSSAS
jgi:hypothetical protein